MNRRAFLQSLLVTPASAVVLSATVLPTPPPAPILGLDSDVDFQVYKNWRCIWLGWVDHPDGTTTGRWFAHQDHLRGGLGLHLLSFNNGFVYGGVGISLDGIELSGSPTYNRSTYRRITKDASNRTKFLGQVNALRALHAYIDRIIPPAIDALYADSPHRFRIGAKLALPRPRPFVG